MSKFSIVSKLSLTGFALFYSLLSSAATTQSVNLDSSTALTDIANAGQSSSALSVATDNTQPSVTVVENGDLLVCKSKSACIVLSAVDFAGYLPDPNCPIEKPECNK